MAMAVIGPSGIETVRRPEPPEDLTDEQATQWRAIVNRMPADHFPRETHQILTQLCRQIVRGNHLAQLIDAAEKEPEFDYKVYLKLVRQRKAFRAPLPRCHRRCALASTRKRDTSYAHKPPPVIDTPWLKKRSA